MLFKNALRTTYFIKKNITWHYKRIYSTDTIKYVYEDALRPIEKQN